LVTGLGYKSHNLLELPAPQHDPGALVGRDTEDADTCPVNLEGDEHRAEQLLPPKQN
jgi:hypothetical protein